MASRRFSNNVSLHLVEEFLTLDRRALDRARLSRDPRFDGKFFIAVKSTGIYCRPICPSPTSKMHNVRYYATAAAAAGAGYRPCLRCRPEAAPGTPAWLGTSAVVKRALRLIDEGFLDQQSVEELAERLGIGARHLHRLFVQHIGASPITVAQTRRLHFAKRLLDETRLPITVIALAAGFGSLRRFNSSFRHTYARAPRELRRPRRVEQTATARGEVVLKLAFRLPYDWKQVRDFLAVRAVPGVERVDAHGYARTVAVSSGHAVICVRPLHNQQALELRVRGAPPAALFQISSAARRMFDVAADPAQIALAFSSDKFLSPLVPRCPGLRIPGAWDPFECSVRAILGQQVSVAAGRTLASRLVARLGRTIGSGEDGLTHLFPTPAQLATADLAGIGLTRARIRALQALAQAVTSGKINFQAPIEEVIAALTSLPGVGPWTAQYVALRALNEPDAFPAADIVLRRMAAKNGTRLSVQSLEALAESWRPWRGYAVIHLWRSAAESAQPPRSSSSSSGHADRDLLAGSANAPSRPVSCSRRHQLCLPMTKTFRLI